MFKYCVDILVEPISHLVNYIFCLFLFFKRVVYFPVDKYHFNTIEPILPKISSIPRNITTNKLFREQQSDRLLKFIFSKWFSDSWKRFFRSEGQWQ